MEWTYVLVALAGIVAVIVIGLISNGVIVLSNGVVTGLAGFTAFIAVVSGLFFYVVYHSKSPHHTQPTITLPHHLSTTQQPVYQMEWPTASKVPQDVSDADGWAAAKNLELARVDDALAALHASRLSSQQMDTSMDLAVDAIRTRIRRESRVRFAALAKEIQTRNYSPPAPIGVPLLQSGRDDYTAIQVPLPDLNDRQLAIQQGVKKEYPVAVALGGPPRRSGTTRTTPMTSPMALALSPGVRQMGRLEFPPRTRGSNRALGYTSAEGTRSPSRSFR
jgi:hypothetical protein